MTGIIFAFFVGFGIASCICLLIHDAHKRAWQAEYRRLMGGIEKACDKIEAGNISQATRILSDTYYGDQ